MNFFPGKFPFSPKKINVESRGKNTLIKVESHSKCLAQLQLTSWTDSKLSHLTKCWRKKWPINLMLPVIIQLLVERMKILFASIWNMLDRCIYYRLQIFLNYFFGWLGELQRDVMRWWHCNVTWISYYICFGIKMYTLMYTLISSSEISQIPFNRFNDKGTR